MNNDEIDALASVLRQQTEHIPHSIIPDRLLETPYLTAGALPESYTCGECGGRAFRSESTQADTDYTIVCQDVREHQSHHQAAELMRYDVDKECVLKDIAENAGLTLVDEPNCHLPAFFAQQTDEGVILCILGPAKDRENAAHKAARYIADEGQPALLFTPWKGIERLYESIEPYAVVGIIQPLSLQTLANSEFVHEAAKTVQLELERKERLFEEEGIDSGDLRRQLEDHPTLIKSRLSTLQTLRENSGNESDGIGTMIWVDFEKVCKAAFAYLDAELKMGEGGVDHSGKEVADAIIGFPESASPAISDDLSRLYGVVDAKSGSTAGFESEAVSKQLDYFEGIQEDKLHTPYAHVHLFVVFDVDADEMVDWYEVAEPHYPDGTGMVVMTANALRQMVDLVQSPSGKSAMNRSERDTRDVFRYFFDPQLFGNAEFKEFAEMPRLRDWNGKSENIQKRYEANDSLLFVTKEMVDRWVHRSLKKTNGIDPLFEMNPPE